MKRSSLTTLFAPPPAPLPRGPGSYLVSILAHAAGCVWLLVGLSHTPRIESEPPARHFTVRVLEAPPIVQQVHPESRQVTAPGKASQMARRELATNEAPAPMPAAAPQLINQAHQLQTLIQPDAPKELILERKMPVPTVVMWSHADAAIKPVIQAPLQKPMLTNLRPSAEAPNREVKMADLRLASSNVAAAMKSLAASTTSPLVVRAAETAQQMPETAAKPGPAPTPARIISISDIQQEGPVAVPLVNATARQPAANAGSAGRVANSSNTSHPNAEAGQSANGSGKAVSISSNDAGSTGKTTAASSANPQSSATSAKGAAGSGTSPALIASSTPGQALTSSPVPANLGPVTHISLPKDGQFGVVVVGSSLAEQYPEIVDVWGRRVVYSVYLHVGGGKNWILQYSVPNTSGGAGGVRPDAPWPYDIVRPRFAADDFNSDALLVHGFVNAAGHFERLALVFPTEFAKVKFLLSALQQWEFRPAHQNGQVAAVEVLLIIPEETQ